MAKRKPAPPTGSGLRETRKSLGLTQTQLAADWGISPRMIRKLEAAPTLSPLYWGAALNLRLGLVTTPQRRTTSTGKPVKVRAPGGKTVRKQPAPAGRVVARLGKSVRAGETIRRVAHWVPFEDPAVFFKVGADHVRQTVLDRILGDIAAHAKRENVVITVATSKANPGASLAGYDVIITSGKDLKKPRGDALYFPAGSPFDLDLADLDALADNSGLEY